MVAPHIGQRTRKKRKLGRPTPSPTKPDEPGEEARDVRRRRGVEQRIRAFESAPEGIILIGSDGRIVDANPAATRLFGYAGQELLCRSYDDILPPSRRVQYRRSNLSHYAAELEPQSRSMDAQGVTVGGLRKDGTEFAAEITLSPLAAPGGPLSMALIRDATEERRRRDEERGVARRIAQLQALSSALGAAVGVDEVTAAVVSASLDVLGPCSGMLSRVTENGCELEILGYLGDLPLGVDRMIDVIRGAGLRADLVSGRQRIPFEAQAPMAVVARSRRILWLRGLAEVEAVGPGFGPEFERCGWRSWVGVPLMSRGELIGVLRLGFVDVRHFDADEDAFLASFAEHCALALDRAQLYEKAIESRDLAERATAMRDQFLAIVAHDLGNPLTAISLLLNGLHDAATGDRTARAGAMKIGEAVTTMSALLDDLTDLAALDAGGFNVTMGVDDLRPIVIEAVERLSLVCAEKGIGVSTRLLSLAVVCDRARLAQVLGNLIGNAIKFTPRGGQITIDARRSPPGARATAPPEVVVSVADTGRGIPPEVREHLFDRYWREQGRDLTKGVGLGLFIAKSILDAHGGKIWVESSVGHGSTFFFTLSAAPPPSGTTVHLA